MNLSRHRKFFCHEEEIVDLRASPVSNCAVKPSKVAETHLAAHFETTKWHGGRRHITTKSMFTCIDSRQIIYKTGCRKSISNKPFHFASHSTMRTILHLILFAICFPSVVAAGEATTEATSNHTYATIIASWFQTNRADILKAANMEIIEPAGTDRYKVRTKTALGEWIYVMEETIETEGALVKIQYVLADRLKTYFSRNIIAISVGPTADGCVVDIKLDQRVERRIVMSTVLRKYQKESMASVKAYLDEHLK